jgi:uncharacterized protein YkuJ
LGDGGWGRDRANRKVFFSEEKKQKTFANWGVCAACKVRYSIGKEAFRIRNQRFSSLA